MIDKGAEGVRTVVERSTNKSGRAPEDVTIHGVA